MRFTAVASALFAVAGTTPDITWISNGAFSAPEPMWLALWGLALIGISSSLRTRARDASQPGQHATARLEGMQPSVVRSL
jgi:hypothetical protein